MAAAWTVLAGAPRIPPPFGGSGIWFPVVLILLILASSRLLGIRLSWLRGLLAAFIGTIAGWADYYGQALQTGTTPDVGLTFGLPALLVTMLVLVTFELAGRPGVLPTVPRGIAGLPHPIRAITVRLDRGRRYVQVSWIAARNGLNPYLRGRIAPDASSPGRSRAMAAGVRLTLEQSGGVFVKLGQVLSTRSDLLPPEFIAELSGLQDRVPPERFLELEPILSEQFGSDLSRVFESIDKTALAAASIAQVHRATLRSGEQVVVKVRRPRIVPLVE